MSTGTRNPLRAPFPYFGGKSRIASVVWERFGDVPNYVEPFAGSLAVLLARPHEPKVETVNDADGMIANFWRALQAEPEQVAHYADWPVNENDLHARHIWLVNRKAGLTERLEGDPDYYDAKIAGWWVWGICCWIGSGWCSGDGPWQSVDGRLVNLVDAGQGVHRKLVHLGNAGQGVNRKRVHLGDAGVGVNRKRVHLGDAGVGVNRKRVHLGSAGQGVNRSLVHLGSAGQGVNRKRPLLTDDGVGATRNSGGIYEWMRALAERLRRVRVCCGDWSRVCGPSPTFKHGLTGVFLDPPYGEGRAEALYATDSLTVAEDVRRWAIENGDNPLLRIALCGYDDVKMPAGWEMVRWSAQGGYGHQGHGRGAENRHREVVWFSPHCIKPDGPRQEVLSL